MTATPVQASHLAESSSPKWLKERREPVRKVEVDPAATAPGTGGDRTRRHGPSRNGAGLWGPVECDPRREAPGREVTDSPQHVSAGSPVAQGEEQHRVMSKILRLMVAVSAVGVFIAAPLSPAHAGEGGFAFEGTADLPQFPCDPAQGDDECDRVAGDPTKGGTFEGTVSGTFAAGTQVGVGANLRLTATFDYREPYDTCPEEGTANGDFQISTVAGSTVVPAGTTISGSGTFTWIRLGANAVITLDGQITVNGTSQNVVGTAVAAFEAPPTVVVTHCPNNGGTPQPLSAEVVGSGELHPG